MTPSQSQISRYPKIDYLTAPPSNPNLDSTLNHAFYEIIHLLKVEVDKQEIQKTNSSKNLDSIKSLQEKDVICLPSDKGGEFCVIERSKYIELGNQHLADETTYRLALRVSAMSIEKKINNLWRSICESKQIPKNIYRTYITNNSELPRLYILIKTHKEGPNIKVRPIVSNVNSPTTKLAWFLGKAISTLLDTVPTHLKSSSELMERIKSITTENKMNNAYPFSLDVAALYTSIPPREAVRNIREIMRNNRFKFGQLDYDELSILLDEVISNNYFTFDGRIYQQCKGLAMGSAISAVMAILYMGTLEKQALLNAPNHAIFARYMDDCFCLTTDRQTAEQIFGLLNGQDTNIVFEIEHPNTNNELCLLDFTIRIDHNGKEIFSFYRKAARSDIFVNRDSGLPQTTKHQVIRNELLRIRERCSQMEISTKEVSKFRKRLGRNGYKEDEVKKLINPARSKRNRRKPNQRDDKKHRYFLKVPFINDKIHHKIQRILRSHELDVGLAYQNQSLRGKVSNLNRCYGDQIKPCSIPNCPTAAKENCFKKNVVYEIRCLGCGSNYIGSTIRYLHTRIKEHLTMPESAINQHLITCHLSLGRICVIIIGSDIDNNNLRIREAIKIREKKPKLNRRDELTAATQLVASLPIT